MAGDWLTIRMAVDMLSSMAGGDHAAKLMIADRLRDLQFTACARIREEFDIGPPDAAPPKPPRRTVAIGGLVNDSASQPTILDGKFWRRSIDWQADQARWDWGLGILLITTRRKNGLEPGRRIVAWETMLRKADVTAALGLAKVPEVRRLPASSLAPAGTTQPTKYEWEQVLVDFAVEITKFGGFRRRFGDPALRGMHARVTRWLQKRAAVYGLHEEPSPSEAKKRARMIIEAFKAMERRESAEKP